MGNGSERKTKRSASRPQEKLIDPHTSVYDGRRLIGHFAITGARTFGAFDATGHFIGRYGSEREALGAVSRIYEMDGGAR